MREGKQFPAGTTIVGEVHKVLEPIVRAQRDDEDMIMVEALTSETAKVVIQLGKYVFPSTGNPKPQRLFVPIELRGTAEEIASELERRLGVSGQ